MATYSQDADRDHDQHRQTSNHQAERQSSAETVHAFVGNFLDERLEQQKSHQVSVTRKLWPKQHKLISKSEHLT